MKLRLFCKRVSIYNENDDTYEYDWEKPVLQYLDKRNAWIDVPEVYEDVGVKAG